MNENVMKNIIKWFAIYIHLSKKKKKLISSDICFLYYFFSSQQLQKKKKNVGRLSQSVTPLPNICFLEMKKKLVSRTKSTETKVCDCLRRQDFYTDTPKTCPDYGRIINQRHFKRIMAMLDDSTIAVGGDNDESDCFIGGRQTSTSKPFKRRITDYKFDLSSVPNTSHFFD